MALNVGIRIGWGHVGKGAHRRLAPLARQLEGKVYRITDDRSDYPDLWEGTGYEGKRGPYTALGDRLQGVNCGHSIGPYYDWMEPRWGDDPLTEEEKEERYRLTQTQRRYEREIRKAKRQASLLESQGLPNAKARVKIGTYQAKVRTLVSENSDVLRREPRREWVGTTTGKQPVALRSSGAIKESGALNNTNDPRGIRRQKHADSYYASVRKRNREREASAVAKGGGVSEEIAGRALSHLFIERHDLEGGHVHFDPDFAIAQCWQRLRSGKPRPYDRLLLLHESLEAEYMAQGYGYDEAHKMANREYNWWQEETLWNEGHHG